MLGICYARLLKVSKYNPKNEKGEKNKSIYNYIVTIFDTGLIDSDFSKDNNLENGEVSDLFIKSEQIDLIDKISKLKKYDYLQVTFNLQGNFKELLSINNIK